MKYINYILLLILISFLYSLLIATNSPLTLQTHSWVYATSSQQEDNSQEETQTSSENEDGPDETNSESESSQGAADSDPSESNSKGNGDNDVSSTNQNSNCPNITEISNLPLYIGQDGCQYPCPSFDSNDENNIPEGCPIEPSSQTNTGFSVKEENPTQLPSQEQQQFEQQNSQNNPNQNAFVNPAINSDTILLFLIVKALLLLRNLLLLQVNLEVDLHKQNQAYLHFQMMYPSPSLQILEM